MTQTIKHLSIREWMLDTYELEQINEIAEHGCSGGTSLIYYNETVAFHDQHEDEIWDMLDEDATSEDCTIIELIANFNGQKGIGSMVQFKNLLCWYAIERVARQIIEENEGQS